jgi:hypothetical protein
MRYAPLCVPLCLTYSRSIPIKWMRPKGNKSSYLHKDTSHSSRCTSEKKIGTEVKDRSTVNSLREKDEHPCCKQNLTPGGRGHKQ